MYFEKATKGDNHILWYVLGFFTVAFAYFIGQIPLVVVQFYKVSSDKSIGTEEVEAFYQTMDFSILNIDKNVGLILMISVFIFALLGLMLVVKYYHKRPFKYLITPHSTINYQKIFYGFGIWFLLAILCEGIIAMVYPDIYYWNFKPLSWIILLVICLLLLPIQTSFEELFIRGYLMPGIAYYTKHKWIALLATSILFGLIHSMNPEVEKYGFWTMQLYYVGAGLFLGLITILDDSLELALGVHAATNIYGATLFSFDGSVLQTDTLVKSSELNPYIMIGIFFASALIFMYICHRKYNWNGFQRLFEPVGPSNVTITNDAISPENTDV